MMRLVWPPSAGFCFPVAWVLLCGPAFAALLPACGSQDNLAAPICSGNCSNGFGGNAGSAGAGGSSGQGGSAYYEGPSPSYCLSNEPPELSAGQGASVCSANLAQTLFRFAVCSCGDLSFAGEFSSDSFDSNTAAYATQQGNHGSVGVNGKVAYAGRLLVDGSLWVGHEGMSEYALHSSTLTSVAGDLHCGGAVGGGRVEVAHDAFVSGDVLATPFAVDGTLTLPEGAQIASGGSIGSLVRADVVVPAPCDCEDRLIPDLKGYATRAVAKNDNDVIALSPTLLVDYQDSPTLTLPCGTYALSSITGKGTFSLRVAGRSALFVDGDVRTGGLIVDLGPQGELDLFIGGVFEPGSPAKLGSKDTPSRVRIYMVGDSPIVLSGYDQIFAGNVYAPRSLLSLAGGLEVFGALFAQTIAFAGNTSVHYDAAILRAGADCPPQPAACETCNDCANQACIQGVCGACASDDQCCAPLVCSGGVCGPLIQ